MFDDDDDDDGMFAKKPAKQPQPAAISKPSLKQPEKKTNLFDDSDDDGMFAKKASSKPAPVQ